QRPEARVGVLVEAHVVTERLGVERPALGVGGVPAEAHERGKRLILLRDADLEMVAGLALVEEQGRLRPRAPRRQVVGVEEERPRPRSVGRARLIASAGLELLAERFVRLDLERSLGNQREEARDLRFDLLLQSVIIGGQPLAALRLELGAGPHIFEELRQRALVADLLLDLLELLGDPRDLAEAE